LEKLPVFVIENVPFSDRNGPVGAVAKIRERSARFHPARGYGVPGEGTGAQGRGPNTQSANSERQMGLPAKLPSSGFFHASFAGVCWVKLLE